MLLLADEVVKDFIDVFFWDMDVFLREMGVGDMVVFKWMKKIVEFFYGRVQVYDGLFNVFDVVEFVLVFGWNVYGSEVLVIVFVCYVFVIDQGFGGVDFDVFFKMGLVFLKFEVFV